jgi:hypothetical protein
MTEAEEKRIARNKRKYLARLRKFKEIPGYKEHYMNKQKIRLRERMKVPGNRTRKQEQQFKYKQRVKSGLVKPQAYRYIITPAVNTVILSGPTTVTFD